ncbi:MAG: cobalamin biosynthesis protein CobW [Ruminococcaceae bacterium]|nr:cobalamin biosynthesis protein CobW [Oscillospiraceae bacterium]
MTKIDIFSGFLGAGKTTLIKKLIKEAYAGEKLVLIENEFGEIGIDGGFLQDAGIEVTEMNSGCICCSLVGDFGEALKKVLDEYAPDRILIEPSGVGKLSDVIKAVKGIDAHDAYLNSLTTVVDAGKCKMYMKNFGEFFIDQVENAKAVIFSHADTAGDVKTENAISLVKEKNHDAIIIATPLDKISGKDILEAIEGTVTLSTEMEKLKSESHHHHHDEECHCHDHHHHDEECHCHDHHHDEECHCHDHHHHDEECHCHDHHHHDEECHCHDHHHQDEECHCHDHDHHHHHADEVFTSWGKETSKKYDKEEIEKILNELSKEEYGTVLRAKGIVASKGDEWIHFDYVPSEPDVRFGSASVIGRICVIGSDIDEEKLEKLF